MQEIAEALKKQREIKGLSLDDLFQRTRIKVDFLQALEAGQFDVLPNTYAKLFIKKYAQEVGLNVEEILALYDQKAPREEPAKRPPPPAHRERNFQPVIFSAIGVFIVALLIWQINQQGEQETASPIDATLAPPVVTQQPISQPARNRVTQEPVQETQTAGRGDDIIPTETTDVINPSNTEISTETNTRPEPVQNSEPLFAEPSTPTPQPVTSTPETGFQSDTQTEALLPEAETTEPVAEEIQVPEMATQQIAADSVSRSAVTQNQIPERLIAEEQTPEAVKTESTTKPLPVQIAPGNPIILSGIVQETTQIIVKADGRILFDGELQTGSRPRWMARENLELTLANQNAIMLSLQNQPLQFDDVTSQTIQLKIDRTQINISPSEQ